MIALLRFWFDLVLAVVVPRATLVAENLIPRQQLIVVRRHIKRPRLRGFDRWLIAALSGRFHRLVDAVLLVKPDTVIRWHRSAWRLLWRWRSRSRPRHPPGRPPVDADLRELIRRMWRQNPTWVQKIIAAQLAKLGYQVSPRTVAKYRPAGLDRKHGQRWTTFIRNHLSETWACDFFVLVTARFHLLYVFVVLSATAGSSTQVSPRIQTPAGRHSASRRPPAMPSTSRAFSSTTETPSTALTFAAASAGSEPDSSPPEAGLPGGRRQTAAVDIVPRLGH